MNKVYKSIQFKVGKKKAQAWIIAFEPNKGSKDDSEMFEYSQCVDYQQKNGGLGTTYNKLSDNKFTQCPNCKHVFDHSLPESNHFDGVELIEPKKKGK